MATFKEKTLFRFQVCGKSVRIIKHELTSLYYVQLYTAHHWKNLNSRGFESYQIAVDYACARSAATIRYNSSF